MNDPFLRYPDVVADLGICRRTIERMVREGSFPRPSRLGKRAVAWPASKVAAWKASRPLNDT